MTTRVNNYEDNINHISKALRAHGLQPRELRKISKQVGTREKAH